MARWIRTTALIVIAAAAVGTGTWAALRYFARPHGPFFGSAPAAPASVPAPVEATRRIKATLFYVSADGLRLAPAERDVLFAEGTSEQAKKIVEALLEPPPGGLASAVPAGTSLRGLFVGEHGDAYIDFSGSLRTNHPGGSLNELLTVYAIVSALTVNLPAISTVQILIDGHEVDTLAGHVDLRRPLPNAPQWTEKGKP
jgi:hypothetical protein